MPDVIRLGGREFVALERSTLEHDTWFALATAAAGITSATPAPGQDRGEFALGLFARLYESGHLWDLLGALVLPAGTASRDWSPALARETGRFIAGLDEPADKDRARLLIVELLLPFLSEGLASWKASTSSSPAPADQAAPPDPETTRGGPGET